MVKLWRGEGLRSEGPEEEGGGWEETPCPVIRRVGGKERDLDVSRWSPMTVVSGCGVPGSLVSCISSALHGLYPELPNIREVVTTACLVIQECCQM